MNRYLSFFLILLLAPSLCAAETQFKSVTGDLQLRFPRDHGAHRDFETEWWYVTGHLRDAQNETFGFELVFFRIGVDPNPKTDSAWSLDSLYLAHFALTDDTRKKFFNAEHRSRGSFGQAGASDTSLNVFLRGWRLALEDGVLRLRAEEAGNSLELSLTSAKPVTLHGENGVSKKGPGVGEASYYSSFPRLLGSGSLVIPGEPTRKVTASAWLDHEFTSSKLARGNQGWDWFALQLDSGEEVMVYQLRDAKGQPSDYSSGTWIEKDGTTFHLARKDFSVSVLDTWKSPKTGVVYPSRWRISVPSRELEVEVSPTVPDQELTTDKTTYVTYWEGRCRLTGMHGKTTISGDAYTELVGYSQE